MNSSSMRRLASDHASLHRSPLPPHYLFPPSTDLSALPSDLTQLTIMLAGPEGTPYAAGLWKLHLKMPHDYPKSPPKAAFKTKIWHPNVEEGSGSVCVDTLKRDWESKLTLRDVLITISCLLIQPNPDSALNSSAGKLLQEDYETFSRQARLMTSIHAPIPPFMKDAVLEARQRGEDKLSSNENSVRRLSQNLERNFSNPPTAPPPEVYEDPDLGDENDEDASKENDPTYSPHPFSPPVKRAPRPSLLGKRPLSDLPTPEAELSDDEEDNRMSPSERNIAANTSAANNACAPPSFKIASDGTYHMNLVNRGRSFSEYNCGGQRGEREAMGLAIQIAEDEDVKEVATRPKKRVCSGDEKENTAQEGETQKGLAVPKKSEKKVGGAEKKVVKGDSLRKVSSNSVSGKGKSGVRVGLRRL